MYLKSLILQGFKSFANRVELSFLPGVAAVVGPNGSGKSNIADAIRWVLGEQSLRALRGSRAQDIIFSGSDVRRAVGMAEVTLCLDNTSGRLPLAFSEVAVTRRAFRSGESQFFINKVPCRLRDIQELFLDSGIGKGSFSLIGQGEIDAVLSASSEDRRLLLEEAAGITRYRTRKEEASEKLADTSEDLLRVNDVMAEVADRLEPLGQAALLQERHQSLTSELRDLETRLHGHDWERLDRQRQNETRRHAAAQQEVERLGKELVKREDEGSQLEDSWRESQQQLDASREALQACRQREQQLMHQLELLRERLRQVKSDYDSSAGELAAATSRAHQAYEEKGQAEEALAAAGAANEEAQSRLAKLEAERAAIDLEARTVGARLAEVRRALTEAERSAARWEAEQRSGEAASGQADSRRGMVAKDRQVHAKRQAEVTRGLEQLQGVLRRLELELAEARAARKTNEKDVLEATGRRAGLEQIRAAQVRRHSEIDSRRRVLREMVDSHEGYYQGVRAVLQARERLGDGIIGSVGELVAVPAELELAIETALGGALQNVITRGERDAEAAIAFLKETRSGRATFLPLDSLRYRVFSPAEEAALQHAELVGVGAEVVSCSALVRPAVDYLLGRSVITRSLHGALLIAKKARGFQRIVSLEGDLVTPGGAITGGAQAKRGNGLLARGRQLEELERQLERLELESAGTARQLQAASHEAEEAQAEREALEARLRRLELASATTSRDVVAKEAELERLREQGERLAAEEALLGEHDSRLAAALATARAQMKESQLVQRSLRGEVQALEQQLAALAGSQEQLVGALTGARVATAEASQRKGAARRDVERLSKTLAEAQAQCEKERTAAASAIQLLEKLQADAQAAEAELEEARAEHHSAAGQVEQARALSESIRQRLLEGRALEKELRRRRDTTQELAHRSEVALARTQAAIAQVEEKLAALGTIPGGQETALDAGWARRRVLELRGQIAALGPVNPLAIEEYQAVRSRHEFLCRQQADLLAAKEHLEQTIAEIDQTSARRLRATYERVREAFSGVFQRLFGGGRADLVWQDGTTNLLDAGLELVAQPPGKKMQTLMALSGGERALTAIALLFAILAVRPSPFCVLDEIDSALDEQNVGRFASMLREYAGQTQFVIITHRQPTMEAADTLCGVTMDRTGASSLVSLNLKEVAASDERWPA